MMQIRLLPNQGVICRTFNCFHDDPTVIDGEYNVGTCFIISKENRHYLLSASHIFPNFNSTHKLLINRSKQWEQIFVSEITRERDVIIFEISSLPSLSIDSSIKIGSINSINLGQEVLFLGFPYNMRMDDINGDVNDGYPLPFCKKGIIASFIEENGKLFDFYVDGQGNKGFSGGPIIYQDYNDNNEIKIIGLVSMQEFDPITIEDAGLFIGCSIDSIIRKI